MEEWAEMEAPLLEIDDLLDQFATERTMQWVKNYHNWPRRELEWVRDEVHRAIHIFAADKPGTYHMAVVAWEDKDGERYGADEWLKRWVAWPEIRNNLHQLLEEAMTTLESWSEKDLKRSKA
jgi:hypothetical protein